jgi:mycothiol synthase
VIERLHVEDRPTVRRLIEEINLAEGLDLPVDVEGDGFIWRENGEIVGVAGVDGDAEIEASGAVHPHYRRRGIARALLGAVLEEGRSRGANLISVVTDDASPDGRAFAEAVGTRETAEYRMILDSNAAAVTPTDDLEIRPAGIEDLDDFVSVTVAAFPHHPTGEARAWLAQDIALPNRRFWIAWNDGEAIGAVRVVAFGSRVYITTLGVRPEYRGRGYGRQLLARTIEILRGEPWDEILIEVETKNANALGLYRSCGFREIRSYGFYTVLGE